MDPNLLLWTCHVTSIEKKVSSSFVVVYNVLRLVLRDCYKSRMSNMCVHELRFSLFGRNVLSLYKKTTLEVF